MMPSATRGKGAALPSGLLSCQGHNGPGPVTGGLLLIFGGTSEGRVLCEAFSRKGQKVVVCTATGYGASLVKDLPGVRAHGERMDAEAMTSFMGKEEFALVIDATHPYATEASRNIREACVRTGGTYLRVIREESSNNMDGVRLVPDMDAVVEYLAETKGNILLATGSKELAHCCRLPDYGERCYARVLPDADMVARCKSLGFQTRHIIAMQGPFSHELNLALLRQFHCSFLVSKSSGQAGGLAEKISAAREARVEMILIQRQEQESGLTLAQAFQLFDLTERTDKERA